MVTLQGIAYFAGRRMPVLVLFLNYLFKRELVGESQRGVGVGRREREKQRDRHQLIYTVPSTNLFPRLLQLLGLDQTKVRNWLSNPHVTHGCEGFNISILKFL